MRQAITTKYLGPTDTRDARIKASCQAGSHTMHWDNSFNENTNHMLAANALAHKLGWDGEWVGGFDQDGRGVFVQRDDHSIMLVNKREQDVA